MRLVKTLIAAALVAGAATCAVAAPVRLSDTQFIAASRCLGLVSSKALGSPDADALRRLVKDQSWGRVGFVYDKADQARDDAESEAARGGAEHMARLVAERDGLCHSFLDTTSATASMPGHSL